MTQKKDRRSARTKKREAADEEIISSMNDIHQKLIDEVMRKNHQRFGFTDHLKDPCEPSHDKAVRVSWTPPTSSLRVNEFFDFTNPDTGCLSRINSVPPGFLVGGCRSDGVPVILHVGGGVQFGWISAWPSMPSWPRSYSSCATMSPEPRQ